MAVAEARGCNRAGSSADAARLARSERRELLLDAAARLLAGGDAESVTMEAVAAQAGVSRALVYKHFENRHDLLAALYERESGRLHAALAADVEAAGDLAGMFGALIRGAVAAQASRGPAFAVLASSGARTRAQREVQRRRDERTLRYFTRHAVEELGMDERSAALGVGIALNAIPSVLTWWRHRPGDGDRLADAYVSMVMGGLRELALGDRAT